MRKLGTALRSSLLSVLEPLPAKGSMIGSMDEATNAARGSIESVGLNGGRTGGDVSAPPAIAENSRRDPPSSVK